MNSFNIIQCISKYENTLDLRYINNYWNKICINLFGHAILEEWCYNQKEFIKKFIKYLYNLQIKGDLLKTFLHMNIDITIYFCKNLFNMKFFVFKNWMINSTSYKMFKYIKKRFQIDKNIICHFIADFKNIKWIYYNDYSTGTECYGDFQNIKKINFMFGVVGYNHCNFEINEYEIMFDYPRDQIIRNVLRMECFNKSIYFVFKYEFVDFNFYVYYIVKYCFDNIYLFRFVDKCLKFYDFSNIIQKFKNEFINKSEMTFILLDE